MLNPVLTDQALRSAAAPAGEAAQHGEFLQALQQALSERPHSLSPKWFYDTEGSRLFDRICELPEYYPTRTERSILAVQAGAIADVVGRGCDLVEFGAGSCAKVRLLLPQLQPRRFVPVDISGEHLVEAALQLRLEHPGLQVEPVAGDYTQAIALPPPLPGVPRVGFFPGSTIGNFSPQEALDFLRRAAQLLRGGGLLLGADLVKDPARLHAAYNDAQGVTAAFNRNVLVRAVRELGAEVDPQAFWHSAFYNAAQQRIEMHLVSQRAQRLQVGGKVYRLEAGESLHTENSHKFTVAGLQALARQAGFTPGAVWTDPEGLFSVHWLLAPAA